MNDYIVSLSSNSISVITSSSQGPQGPQGPQGLGGSSGATSLSYASGVNLGGNRGVMVENSAAFYASNINLAHAGKLLGITMGAASQNSSVNIQGVGELDGFSGLTVNSKVYLQENGVISSTMPTAGFIQQVGIALTSTKILINIQPPIVIG